MKKKVGFVCVGNACRSQMAEGFARAYGSEAMEIHSAGLYPALSSIPEQTIRTMAEKGIDVSAQFPKDYRVYPAGFFDLVINMSGLPLRAACEVRAWQVDDPYGSGDRVYRRVRDEIEILVQDLVRELETKP
ncbi:MAG: low molecular weight phosphatase family protein [Bryobacterales bacterium]|nr:low molecular weight phosphatase family protein [Bryobacterales bacterium]